MDDITKHDTKLERESNNGENSWVHFFVVRNAISVYYLLECPGEFICIKKGWSEKRVTFIADLLHLRRVERAALSHLLDLSFKSLSVFVWAPHKTYKNFFS